MFSKPVLTVKFPGNYNDCEDIDAVVNVKPIKLSCYVSK